MGDGVAAGKGVTVGEEDGMAAGKGVTVGGREMAWLLGRVLQLEREMV